MKRLDCPKQRRTKELTVIYNASRMESIDEDDDMPRGSVPTLGDMESIDEDDDMPRGPVPTLGDAKGPQLEEDEVSVISDFESVTGGIGDRRRWY
jgi:hypothetical protein